MKIYFTLFMVFMIVTCNNNQEIKNDCSDAICTMEFRSISVSLKDQSGMPISLDRFKVTATDTGKDLTRDVNDLNWELIRQTGTYPIFGDEFSKEYQNKEVEILFEGFIGNDRKTNLTFLVGADCCHVQLIDGQLEVVLDI
ncbi:MAG: hypothetical protein WBN28_06905 [Lutimonas sp.]